MLDISQRERDCTIVEVVKLFTHQHSWLFNPSILRCRGRQDYNTQKGKQEQYNLRIGTFAFNTRPQA